MDLWPASRRPQARATRAAPPVGVPPLAVCQRRRWNVNLGLEPSTVPALRVVYRRRQAASAAPRQPASAARRQRVQARRCEPLLPGRWLATAVAAELAPSPLQSPAASSSGLAWQQAQETRRWPERERRQMAASVRTLDPQQGSAEPSTLLPQPALLGSAYQLTERSRLEQSSTQQHATHSKFRHPAAPWPHRRQSPRPTALRSFALSRQAVLREGRQSPTLRSSTGQGRSLGGSESHKAILFSVGATSRLIYYFPRTT